MATRGTLGSLSALSACSVALNAGKVGFRRGSGPALQGKGRSGVDCPSGMPWCARWSGRRGRRRGGPSGAAALLRRSPELCTTLSAHQIACKREIKASGARDLTRGTGLYADPSGTPFSEVAWFSVTHSIAPETSPTSAAKNSGRSIAWASWGALLTRLIYRGGGG